MRKIAALLLCLVLTAGLLSGCGSQEEPYIPTGSALAGVEDTTPTAPEEKPDQVFSVAYYPDRSLNPYNCTDFTNRMLFSFLYQGLFSVNRAYEVEPVLCRRYTVSPDNRSYTFYAENATFSDGSTLRAEDVYASLMAAMESPYYAGRFDHVEAIEQSADGGVTVRLDCPYENLPLILDIPIVKADEVLSDRPRGTGPYALARGSGGESLRRVTAWWCEAELPAYAASIPLVEADSPAHVRDSFEFGEVGLVCADPGAATRADYRCDYEVWNQETGIFLYLGCNAESAVFSNNRVRAALTYAIDRDTLVETYFQGFGDSATLPASPNSPFYSRSLASKYEYDPLKFVEALRGVQIAEPVILLLNSDDTLRLQVGRAIAEMLMDCGMQVETKEVGGDRFMKALRDRTYDLYLGQTKLSANMDLSAFFSPTGGLSYGNMDNGAIYSLCKQALENSGNYYNLHQMVVKDGQLCPVAFRSYAVYATRGVFSTLSPSRDNVAYYSLGKTMEDVLDPS